MKNLSQHLGDPRRTSQREAIPGREAEMEKNAAGGYSFKAGDWERLDRFLIIGTEGGTYYAGEREMTISHGGVVRRCLAEDRIKTLNRIIDVSFQGLAPKNDPAIMALALSFVALKGEYVPLRSFALQKVCRTGTHLFQFLEAVTGMRGGGRALNGAVRAWLSDKDVDKLALQMVKYRNRAGWTWCDVMRKYRPKPPVLPTGVEAELEQDVSEISKRSALYTWAAGKGVVIDDLPTVAFNTLRVADIHVEYLASFIKANRLPWECVPSEHTTNPAVLDALFDHMPMMATVRQLSKLQAHGVLEKRRSDVIARLTDEDTVRKSRIHPVSLMLAASAYEKGSGRHLTWTPDPRIVDALDDSFQMALKVAEPTGKKILVAIDCSGSMHHQTTSSGIELFKIAAAMALTYVRTDDARVIAFDCELEAMRAWHLISYPELKDRKGVYPLPLSSRMRITDAMRAITDVGQGGGTDCALPFKHALENDIDVDCFVVFTDNETWAGQGQHPAQALQAYRDRKNPNAKVVWCAMTAGDATCGDPSDARMLSITGFDSSAPQLVGNFAAGKF